MKSEGAGKKSNILAYVQYCSSLTESNGLGAETETERDGGPTATEKDGAEERE